MEVTRKNFNGMLPLISTSIEKADFLVIDAEFTGLLNGQNVSIFDSPQEYYVRLLNGASDFLLIQYGLCAFYWDETKNHYMNDAYNFYLFPRGRPGPEKTFLCQSSSLDFLAAQGFDFNKLIREGISYMTEPTESRLRENLAERQKSYATEKETITIPEENKQQIEDICKSVREFLDTNNQNEMEIDRCNAFVRRLLFQEIGARFKDEAFVESKVLENKNRVLKVTRKKSGSDDDDRDAKKKQKEWEEFEEAVGFSKVARMISQSEKLVIGHNMLLDLLHTLNHFFQPLPSDYTSFKEFAHCMFPKLLDTKYMSSLPPFKDKVNSSVLQHLLTTLSEPPFSLPKAESQDGRGYSQAEDKHHEAGYDAYVTGLCFLAMRAHLARMRGEPAAGRCGDCAALRPFLNKLYLARTAHQDSPYINLAGADPSPSRDHVFHLTFPKEWQRQEINQLFSPYGQITVQFLDEVSALIALSRRDQARDVLRTIGHGGHSGRVSLIPYAKYKQMHDKGKQQHDKSWRKTESLLQVTSDSQRGRQAPSSSASNNTNSKPHPAPAKCDPSAQARSARAAAAPAQAAQAAPPRSPGRPERARSSSASATSPTHTTRKRTSSGVFKIDNSEPPPKRADLVHIAPDVHRQDRPSGEGGRQRTGNDAKAKVKGAKAKAAKDKEQKKDKEKQSDEVFNESEKWE